MAKFEVIYRLEDRSKTAVSGAPFYKEVIEAENYFYDRDSASFVFRTAAKSQNKVANVSNNNLVSIRKISGVKSKSYSK